MWGVNIAVPTSVFESKLSEEREPPASRTKRNEEAYHLMSTNSSGSIPFKYFHLWLGLYLTAFVSPFLSG